MPTSATRSLHLINIVRSEEGADQLRHRFPDTPVVATCRPRWQDEVRKLAAGRPITAVLDPIGGRLAGDLLGLLSPDGTLVAYGALADEPMSLHAVTLLGSALTIRGATISRWVATTSPQQRAWDVATAVAIAERLGDAFEVAGHYPVADIGAAAEHAVRPGKVGTVLVEFD